MSFQKQKFKYKTKIFIYNQIILNFYIILFNELYYFSIHYK